METYFSWLMDAAQVEVATLLLVIGRISGIFLTAPIIGGSYVPMQVRALVSVVMAVALWPSVSSDAAGLQALSWSGLIGGLALEIFVGIVLGFTLECYFQAVRFAGDLIGRSAGFAAAEYFDPATEVMTGPVGDLFHISIVAIFFMVDGHHWWLLALQQSYLILPLGGGIQTDHLGAIAAYLADDFFRLGAALSLPIMVAILCLSVVDGVIARAVPQINILQISFIVRILVTVVLLLGSVPAIVAFLAQVLAMAEHTGESMVALLAGMAG